MATKKGDKRKTARRAYMPRRKGYKKPAKSINVLADGLIAYIAGDALFGDSGLGGYNAVDALKAQGYNPFSTKESYAPSAIQAIAANVSNNKVAYAELGISAIAAEWIGRNTSFGRKIALKTKKWNFKLF